MNEASIRQTARSAAVICLCFLLTSTGWLSWEYHLLEQIPAEASDIWTMIVGYLLQAAGIGLFALLIRRKEQEARRVFSAALVMHMLFMIPAVISPYTVGTLVFGLLINLNCGVIAGYYLYDLTIRTAPSRRATAFGLGYGLAILAQWLLSLIGGGSLYYSEGVLLVCLVLTSAVLAAVWKGNRTEGEKEIREPPKAPGKHLLVSVCVLVLLFGIVNSSGFAFPSADLGKTVNVELSRLVYAAGLMIAGIVADRNRRYSAIFALSALMIPFIILALREETVSSVIFWALSYFTFGFYSVYRITVFSDIAADHRRPADTDDLPDRRIVRCDAAGILPGLSGSVCAGIPAGTGRKRKILPVCHAARPVRERAGNAAAAARRKDECGDCRRAFYLGKHGQVPHPEPAPENRMQESQRTCNVLYGSKTDLINTPTPKLSLPEGALCRKTDCSPHCGMIVSE